MGHKVPITRKKDEEMKQLRGCRCDEQATCSHPMTDREAEKEARRRWGNKGQAWHHAYSKKGEWDYCRVGVAVGDVRDDWKVYGRGKDWREAFLDATARGK